MKKLSITGFTIILTVFFVFATSMAESLPSSKSAVATSDIMLIESTTETQSWDPILITSIKVPEQKDLVFHVSMECGLYTNTHVKSKGGKEDTSTAEATIKVRVRVNDENGNLFMYAGPAGENGIVFASRSQELMAKFGGILTNDSITCNENGCIIDYTKVTDEELRLILSTMTANAFNFLAPNLSSGIYEIVVEAEISSAGSADAGSFDAYATIGLGSLVVDEIRMVK
ncbi:MAG: hypothetical protein PVG87_19365 [Desulfobacteraceae bacterium]